jgi:hypothetical protein
LEAAASGDFTDAQILAAARRNAETLVGALLSDMDSRSAR